MSFVGYRLGIQLSESFNKLKECASLIAEMHGEEVAFEFFDDVLSEHGGLFMEAICEPVESHPLSIVEGSC